MKKVPQLPFLKSQRGFVWWIVAAVVAVIAAVIVGVVVATSPPPASAGTTVPPGCFPAGTQCRVFIQNEVSCCGGQQVVGPVTGACFGWWDALPCR